MNINIFSRLCGCFLLTYQLSQRTWVCRMWSTFSTNYNTIRIINGSRFFIHVRTFRRNKISTFISCSKFFFIFFFILIPPSSFSLFQYYISHITKHTFRLYLIHAAIFHLKNSITQGLDILFCMASQKN